MEKQINPDSQESIKIEEEREQSSSIIRDFTLQFYRKLRLRKFLEKAKEYNRDQIDVNQLNKQKKVSENIKIFISDVIKNSILKYKEYYLNMLKSFMKKYSNKLIGKILSEHKKIRAKLIKRAEESEVIRNFVKGKIKKKPKPPEKPKEVKKQTNSKPTKHCRETCLLCNPLLLSQYYKQQEQEEYKRVFKENKENKENHGKVLKKSENPSSKNLINNLNNKMYSTIYKKAAVLKTSKPMETKTNNEKKLIKPNIKDKPKTSTAVGISYKKLEAPPVLSNNRASARIIESNITKKMKVEKLNNNIEKNNNRSSLKEKDSRKKLNKSFNTQRN